MNLSPDSKIEQATTAYHQLINRLQSIILGTVDEKGNPHTSYAPFVWDENRNLYFLASELAIHTRHLLQTPKASILFIEDEEKTAQIFGRCRLDFDCRVTEIHRHQPEWNRMIDKLQQRFGEIVTMIASLPDFHLFKLIPIKGRFVRGFGEIYEIKRENLDILIPVKTQRNKESD